jgi:hypothetical protein
LKGLKAKLSTWVPPGHFYSPLVDPADSNVRNILDNFDELDLPSSAGVVLDDAEMLRTLDRLSSFCRDLPFTAKASGQRRYFYENGAFEYGEAAVYFGMIRDLRPRRIIEVGSGFSSSLAMDTNDEFFGRGIDITFIEPCPTELRRSIGGEVYYERRLIPSKLQDVPTALFETLDAATYSLSTPPMWRKQAAM